MSSTRNKRKRVENDLTQASRRRTRDVGDDDVPAAESHKNEANGSMPNPPESTSAADASTSQTSTNNTAPPDEEAMKTGAPVVDTGAGSTSQTSSAKGPLHAENAEPSNTSTEDPNPDSRTSKIRALITHRTVLLSRIRLCRNAAEKRLSVTKAGDLPDEQEIQTHLHMSKLASQAARKARGDDPPSSEKRTSLSLRRGSGVGKRMNAALSSLAPGSGITVGPPPHATVLTGSGNSEGKTFLSKPPAAGIVPELRKNPGALLVAPRSLEPTTPTMPSTAGPKSAASALSRQSSVGQVRSSTGKGLKSTTPAGVPPRSLVPSKDPGKPRIPQSRTLFPEAMMLRKKREAVEGKLRAVLERQRAQGISESSVRPKSSGTSEPPPRTEFPKRRKTHWDRLLQEMNWMATDFIEERKWKASAGRTLSSALRSSEFARGTSPKKASTPEPCVKTEKEEVKLQDNDAKRHNKPNSVTYATKYLEPSVEERREAKKKSSLISTMISELAIAINESNGSVHSDRLHAAALDRYKKVRAALVHDASTSTSQPENETIPPTSAESNPQCGDATMEDHVDSGQITDSNEITFSDINKRLQNLGLANGRKETFPYKELSHATTAKKFSLSEDQQKMVEFVDQVWGSSVGAALSGMPTSGKTVATCSLLWKHRVDGPQLVVCPPASVLRWKYELCHFNDLRAVNFGQTGGISCSLENPTDDLALQAGDVVICEYSSMERLIAFATKRRIRFQTLCVDCRHPIGMFGSLGKETSVSKVKSEWHGYNELLSTEWWEKLVQLESPRRLTIDYCDPDLYSLDRSGLGRRRQLEVLSLRSALLLGPENFRPSAYPLQRTVISWARHQGKKPGEDKFERVRRVLKGRLSGFSRTITHSLAASHDSWDIHRCEMPEAQREAYDSCCSDVRGALSSALGDANTQDGLGPTTHATVAAALFRLRKICLGGTRVPVESRYDSGVLSPRNYPFSADFTLGDEISSMLPPDNGSQPDVELAELLLSSSGKFMELVSVLRYDCGINIDCHSSVMDRIPNRKGSAQKTSLKVAILASLPRTQVLLSRLLGALGISHKVMRREAPQYANNSQFVGRDDKSNQSALAWAETQINLLAFNLEENTRDTLRLYACPDVVVVSPDSLASWHGGIGIDRVDVVMSIDEDWSGREMGTIKAALARWRASRSLRKVSTKMIRLISKDTIEQKVFPLHESSTDHSWPLDPSGNHLLSLDSERLLPLYNRVLDNSESVSELPGIHILKMRGDPLDAILVTTTHLSSLFDGSKMTFLPSIHSGQSDAEMRKGLDLLQTIYKLEAQEASKLVSSAFRNADWLALPLKQTEGVGSGFVVATQTVMSCADLPFLSSRIFLECQVLAPSSISSPAAQGVSPVRLSDFGTQASMASRDGKGSGLPSATYVHLGSTPNEMAESLLSYNSYFETMSFKRGAHDSNSVDSSSKRVNLYSRVFSAAWDSTGLFDGSQGCEPLVFFPPVLPKVQLAPKSGGPMPVAKPKQGENAPSTSTDEILVGPFEPVVAGQKRRDVENTGGVTEQESKRPRAEATASDDSMPVAMTSTETTTVEVLSGSDIQGKAQRTNPTLRTTAFDSLEDDYGLLGGGVLPLPAETALLMATESIHINGGSDCFLRGAAPCDNEEQSAFSSDNGNASLALVSLFIKKRHRGLPHRPNTVLPSHLRFENAVGLTSMRDVNVEDPGKKIKKKPGGQTTQSAFTLVPLVGQNRPGAAPSALTTNGKDEPKHRMLATYVSRQYGTGLTMFESASFRIATIQVQNRVKARVDRALSKALLSGEAASGLPAFVLNRPQLSADLEQGIVHFAPVVEQLQAASNTGDAARAMATAQLSALSRSHYSPCRVDFGPFGSGFLSSTSGMAGLSPNRSRLGVSLPMGVKVANSSHDHKQPSWSQEEDTLLKAAVIRFGMNWIIIARALSGHQGFLIGSNGADIIRRITPSSRSSRQCRDRWHTLLRTLPSLANEVRMSETMLQESYLKITQAAVEKRRGETLRSSRVPGAPIQKNLDLLAHSSIFQDEDEMDADEPLSAQANKSSSENSAKKSFAKLKASMAKHQVIPLVLPGIPPGGQPNQPVPSHPSHMQSVQSSVAAQWSNGRTELWPLQILDCADKHRAATLASTQRAGEMKAASPPGFEAAPIRSAASAAVTSAHVVTTSAVPRAPRPTAAPVPGVQGRGQGPSAPPQVRKTPNTTNNAV